MPMMSPEGKAMNLLPANRSWLSAALNLLAVGAIVALLPAIATAKNGATPKFEQIEQVVTQQMARKPGYQPGDLISRADVEPVFNRLMELGFEPADRETLYDAFLPHNSFLVSELSTAAGQRFMRKVSKYPQAYDRLERLSWMPAGRELIRELTQRSDGPEVLQSLTTPEGAKAVEKIMAGDVRGANFALPTGHIHTAEQLLERVRESHKMPAKTVAASHK